MRFKALLTGDIRFQFKYGFYYLYLIFSILYVSLLFVFPESWRQKAAVLMIFSDPAAMGLYFMGAIILFEKSERVLNSLAISPVLPYEYVLSKLCSIGIISELVGLTIGFSGDLINNIFYFAMGIFLCSCLFSAVGLIIACEISTLNQFVVASIPAEIIINIPALAWLFGYKKTWLLFHPGVSMIELCIGSKHNLLALLNLLLWTGIFILLTFKVTRKMLKSVGGIKL